MPLGLEDIKAMSQNAMMESARKHEISADLLLKSTEFVSKIKEWQPYHISIVLSACTSTGALIPMPVLKGIMRDGRRELRDLAVQMVGYADTLDNELIEGALEAMSNIIDRGEYVRAKFVFQNLITSFGKRA